MVGVAGLHAGVRWINEKGIAKLHKQEITLYNKLRNALHEIEGVITYCVNNTDNQNPVLCFNVNGFEAGDVGTMLDVDYNIATRTGLHCAPKVHEVLETVEIHGTVRMSIGPFNTEKHIDAAIEAVKDIASIRN
ncbi:MAG: aminotransferase class V-fold PLP-dependent enzyme [Bacteroidales bacterium]